jgi:hypothetical protein
MTGKERNVVASVLARLRNHSKLKGAPFQQVLQQYAIDFNTDTLLKAVDATFRNRETPAVAEEFEALMTDLVGAHRSHWNAFVKKMGDHQLIDAFGKVLEDLKIFAMPVFRSLARDEKLAQQWKAGKGWVSS